MKQLELYSKVGCFTVTAATWVEEINACVYTLTHATGATLYYIGKNDSNKVFGVAFTTPPADDTGVFHIIEHSVLCGSKKYPVREPFVNLLKTSMSTFLNAITYPDRTVYPVASTSEKDLTNLMSVYLDAVFEPNMASDRRIFMQEGWHYDFAGGGAPSVSGVVYNEMKGAMSPDRISDEALYKALFPDSPYGCNSGGDPAAIPQLTYGDFIDTYRRHYTAANAVFYLYGDLDLESKVALIERYLAPGGEKQTIKIQTPVTANVTAEYDCAQESTDKNTYITLGYAASSFEDTEKLIALSVLDDALSGSNTSPLKRAVLDSGIAVDFESGLDVNMLQPVYKLRITKTDPEGEEKFLSIIESTVRGLIEKGLPMDEISASLNCLEFNLKEDDSGSRPKGLYYFLRILSSVTYGGAPDKWLAYGKTIDSLKARLGSDYFARLTGEIFFGCRHKAVVVAKPVPGLTELENKKMRDGLAARFAGMPDSEKKELAAMAEDFKKYQNEADSREALSSLPTLSLSDLAEPPKGIETTVSDRGGITVLSRAADTNKITYVQMYFDLSCLTAEELPYAAFLSSVLDELPTRRRSSEDIKRIIKTSLGEWSAGVRTFTRADNECTLLLSLSYSALPDNLKLAAELTDEILTERVFDKKSIVTALKQDVEDMKQALRSSGHSTAMRRLRANLTKSGAATELLGGAALYDTLKKAVKKPDALVRRIAVTAEKILTKSNLTISVTGNYDGGTDIVTKTSLPAGERVAAADIMPKGANEAFEAPGSVNYAACGVNICDIGEKYDCRLALAAKVLEYEYLWNEVRAKGGAYGVGLITSRSGDVLFYSYRDPALKATFDAFAKCGDYLESADISQSELDGYIISIIADMDKPISPRLTGLTADSDYFLDVTEQYKREVRERILTATPADIKAFAPLFKKVATHSLRAAVGSKKAISQLNWDNIEKI